MSGRVGDLSKEQDECLQKFKERLKDVLKPCHDDFYLLRWLRARNFDLNKSESMLRNHFSWRVREEVDNIKDWTCPEVIQKYFTGGLCGLDVDGCPIWIDPFGQIDLRGMLKSAKKADVIKAKVQLLEDLHNQIFLERSKQEGKRVDSIIILYDLAKLGMKHLYKPGVDAYCEMITMFEDHYPETLKYAIVINAPRFFPIAYNIVKPFLSEATAKKTIILGTNYHATLNRYISPDELPVCYGGKRSDPDGDPTCKSQIGQGGEIPRSYYKQQMSAEDIDNAVCATVGRGSSLQVECEVDVKNSAIRWQFSSEGYDIGFGVYRRTSEERQKASQMEEVMKTQRVNSHLVPEDGSITCTDVGLYILRFDNTYSWARAKKIHYLVEVLEPDTEDFTNPNVSQASFEVKSDI
uniref:SEC14-like protein 2 isoform X1 n=2 Tax=Crassostrea virginica TaxID=6565 RepID=A0A8B8ERC1_CRAVI|nr:SEC14-like protein 2 isoform X1 [Crassostrea virginica]